MSALTGGLERGQFEVVPADQVLSAVPAAASCGDKGCVTDVAKATAARYVVRSKVTIQDRDYDIHVELLDGETGALVAENKDGCEICGVVDVSSMFSAVAGTLQRKLDALAKGPANLKLVSEPAGALVTLDGEIIGTTPIEQPMIPGKHLLRVSADGYIAIEREVTFVEGVSEEPTFTLEPIPSKLPGRGWGWASLGVGVAALGGGVALTWLHDRQYTIMGQCDGENKMTINGVEQCRYLYNTKWYAMGALIAGAALTTLGAVILIEAASRKDKTKGASSKPTARLKPKRSRPRFGLGPGSVLIQGEF